MTNRPSNGAVCSAHKPLLALALIPGPSRAAWHLPTAMQAVLVDGAVWRGCGAAFAQLTLPQLRDRTVLQTRARPRLTTRLGRRRPPRAGHHDKAAQEPRAVRESETMIPMVQVLAAKSPRSHVLAVAHVSACMGHKLDRPKHPAGDLYNRASHHACCIKVTQPPLSPRRAPHQPHRAPGQGRPWRRPPEAWPRP